MLKNFALNYQFVTVNTKNLISKFMYTLSSHDVLPISAIGLICCLIYCLPYHTVALKVWAHSLVVFLQSTKFSKLLTTQLVFTVVEVELLVMFSKLVGFRVGERNSNPNTIFLGLNSMLQTN